MPDSRDHVHVHVDFNDVDMDGRFFVLPEDATGSLALNMPVVLQDAEGNNAQATVVEVMTGGRAMLAMVAGSWRSGEIAAPSFNASFVFGRPRSFGKLSEVPSGVAGLITKPPLVLAHERGAVLSSL